jgi:hypothetical protein
MVVSTQKRGRRTEPATLESLQQQMTELGQQMVILNQQMTRIMGLMQGQQKTRPTPRRVEQHTYLVTVGTRTYRVVLPEKLPERGARQRLHTMLLNNELVGTGGSKLRAQVTMQGNGQVAQKFNGRAANARLDVFRDSYLGHTYKGGRFVNSSDVRIASIKR